MGESASEDATPERHQDVGAETDRLGAELALEPDEAAEARGEQQQRTS